MEDIILCNKRFAGESHSIREWITPFAIEVQDLFIELRQPRAYDTAIACWQWINDSIAYPFTRFFGQPLDHHELIAFRTLHYINSEDFWQFPYETIARACLAKKYGGKTFGDCEDTSLVFTSVLRNQLPATEIYCVVGNYLYLQPTGHAWVKIKVNGSWWIIDTTSLAGSIADETIYDEYVLFNDEEVHELKPVELILDKCHEREKVKHLTNQE